MLSCRACAHVRQMCERHDKQESALTCVITRRIASPVSDENMYIKPIIDRFSSPYAAIAVPPVCVRACGCACCVCACSLSLILYKCMHSTSLDVHEQDSYVCVTTDAFAPCRFKFKRRTHTYT